jgi:hypothetical protein
MITKGFQLELAAEIPVLFAYIGWTRNYDGTEQPRGRHGYLKKHPDDLETAEANAFVKRNGLFECGIGLGNASPRIHVVFVALDPASKEIKVVGMYAGARTESRDDWSYARTRSATLIPVDKRPPLPGGWTGQGVRRWARNPTANTHPQLSQFFNRLRSRLPALAQDRAGVRLRRQAADQTYWDIPAVEGKLRKVLVAQRYREASLRDAKIKQAMKDNEGRLVCEVPGCAFDFCKTYGEIGVGYAHVHHLRPLGRAGKRGEETTLDTLAIVCANCHAMIHRDGLCRELRTLIPKTRGSHG